MSPCTAARRPVRDPLEPSVAARASFPTCGAPLRSSTNGSPHPNFLTCSRSRAQPGPGSLIVVLIGLKATGLAGAAASFIAMFTLSGLVVHLAARHWQSCRALRLASHWSALAPVAVGLTLASGLSLRHRARVAALARDHRQHCTLRNERAAGPGRLYFAACWIVIRGRIEQC
jgi:hypothetical protein